MYKYRIYYKTKKIIKSGLYNTKITDKKILIATDKGGKWILTKNIIKIEGLK